MLTPHSINIKILRRSSLRTTKLLNNLLIQLCVSLSQSQIFECLISLSFFSSQSRTHHNNHNLRCCGILFFSLIYLRQQQQNFLCIFFPVKFVIQIKRQFSLLFLLFFLCFFFFFFAAASKIN